MQDRFKFRVWDKENKCLHCPTRYSNFTIVNGTVVKIESYPTANSAYLGKQIAWEFDDAVIMQCTGLKDKNGKLIYEGDIVKMYSPWDAAGPAGYDTDTCIVKFDKAVCGFTPMCNYDCDCCIYHEAEKLEVIGNIYATPELLESN